MLLSCTWLLCQHCVTVLPGFPCCSPDELALFASHLDRMSASTSQCCQNCAGAQHHLHRHNTFLCRRKEHLTPRKRQAVLCQAAKQQQQEKVLDSERPDPGNQSCKRCRC